MYGLSQLFFSHGFKSQESFCNGCHDLAMLRLNLSDIVIITAKTVDYCCSFYDISRSKAINLLKKLYAW